VVEKIAPGFAVDILAGLPHGVVVVSGTYGKTTTTKVVTELLRAAGLKVFTYSTGSNFMRGVIASLLDVLPLSGRLDADIAVLELDEAHAVHFVRKIAPRYSLLLNVMRDQLDRFGEIDHTAGMLSVVAAHTTGTVVINREDSRLASIPQQLDCKLAAQVQYFGLNPALRSRFPSDDELYNDELGNVLQDGDRQNGDNRQDGDSPYLSHVRATNRDCPRFVALPAVVSLESLQGSRAGFDIEGRQFSATLSLKGIYNAYNAAAALALARAILQGSCSDDQLVSALAGVTSAFGRGETVEVNGAPVDILLVKNPGGFRLALESFNEPGYSTMIIINDEYADGRDMSWLFDVDFGCLAAPGVQAISGTRAWDMALRLQYDEVPFDQASVLTDIDAALQRFLAAGTAPKRIFATYTAMLHTRRHLAHLTTVSEVR
jgi:UDP-N-acetylmuramyl tripeptide synthase